MNKFCELVREYATEIINFKKKKMKLLRKERKELYANIKICCICKEKFQNEYWKLKNIYRGF